MLPTAGEVFALRKLLPQTNDYDFNVHGEGADGWEGRVSAQRWAGCPPCLPPSGTKLTCMAMHRPYQLLTSPASPPFPPHAPLACSHGLPAGGAPECEGGALQPAWSAAAAGQGHLQVWGWEEGKGTGGAADGPVGKGMGGKRNSVIKLGVWKAPGEHSRKGGSSWSRPPRRTAVHTFPFACATLTTAAYVLPDCRLGNDWYPVQAGDAIW